MRDMNNYKEFFNEVAACDAWRDAINEHMYEKAL